MPEPSEDKQLSECTVTDLMDALAARCPASVMALLIPDDRDEVSTVTFVKGNRMACLGMANLLHEVMISKLKDNVTRYDPDADTGADTPGPG